MIGLLRAYRLLGDIRYLEAAKRLGDWIELNARDPQGPGGYTGGYEGWEPTPQRVTWKSTEHNLDLYVAFMTVFDLTGEAAWQERALHAKQFVRAMWQACGTNRFATGTHTDRETPNCDFAPADVNTWALTALGEVGTYGAGIDWVLSNCPVEEPCFWGFPATGMDFNDDRDGIWWEGTAHTVTALRIKGEQTAADILRRNLRLAQFFVPNTKRKGLVATCHDGASAGIEGFAFFNRLHIAATAWYTLAERQSNPFWGIRTSDPIPHDGE